MIRWTRAGFIVFARKWSEPRPAAFSHITLSFFLEAFSALVGPLGEREPRRYEVTHVPAVDS